MSALIALVRGVDWFNEWVGRAVSWLTLATVLVCFTVVVLRYGFSYGEVWMQELYVWFHAIVFMVGAGYTLKQGGHVRVDVLYARMSVRRKAIVDLVGTVVFMLPWLFVLVYFGWPFVWNSWVSGEVSAQPGGMPAFYLIKTVLLLFVIVLGLQALALLARSVLVIAGREEFAQTNPSH